MENTNEKSRKSWKVSEQEIQKYWEKMENEENKSATTARQIQHQPKNLEDKWKATGHNWETGGEVGAKWQTGRHVGDKCDAKRNKDRQVANSWAGRKQDKWKKDGKQMEQNWGGIL